MDLAWLPAVVLEIVAAAWPVACYAGVALGVIALFRIGAAQSRHDSGNSVKLHGRALPTMLFVTLLAFFAAEMRQLGDHISRPRLVLVLLHFAAATAPAGCPAAGEAGEAGR